MKFHGITLQEGSKVYNLTVAAGTTFPSSPDEGELFFRNDTAVNVKGLYIYVGGDWDRISSTDTTTVQTGSVLPSLANAGDLFYRNSNDGVEGLYVFNDAAWINVSEGSASPAGANTQIQFNDNGVFGASSKFTWDDSTSKLTLSNTSDYALS